MKKLAAVAVLGLAAVAARRYAEARDGIADVAPELRSALVPLTTVSVNKRTLPFIRITARTASRRKRLCCNVFTAACWSTCAPTSSSRATNVSSCAIYGEFFDNKLTFGADVIEPAHCDDVPLC